MNDTYNININCFSNEPMFQFKIMGRHKITNTCLKHNNTENNIQINTLYNNIIMVVFMCT